VQNIFSLLCQIQEVIGGMLELEPSSWLKPKRHGPDEEKKMLAEFTRQWDSFDWTKQLQ